MAFSNVLKQLREENHLSQKEIADYLGITRQAVAAYELAKREPDYSTLQRLADYFKVSVDYLLGRTRCKDSQSITVGANIALVKGPMTVNQLSEEIGRKTGVLLYPEILQMYENGERVPTSSTIKVLSKYAGVRDTFFYQHNTKETFQREREIYRLEVIQEIASEGSTSKVSGNLDLDALLWMSNEKNRPYLKLAMEIQQSGLSANVFKPFLEGIKEKHDS